MMNRKEYLEYKQNLIKEIDFFENNIERDYKQNSGSFYTNINFINDILIDIFSNKTIDEISKMKILEPCVGTGNYIFALLFSIIKPINNTPR